MFFPFLSQNQHQHIIVVKNRKIIGPHAWSKIPKNLIISHKMIFIIIKNSFWNKLRLARLNTHPKEESPSRDLRPGPPGCKGRNLANPKHWPFKNMLTRLTGLWTTAWEPDKNFPNILWPHAKNKTCVILQQSTIKFRIFLFPSFTSGTGNNNFSTHLLGWSVTVGRSLHHRPGVAHVGCICTKCDLVTNKTFPRLALSQMRGCSCALPVALLTELGQPKPTALLQIPPNGYYTHLIKGSLDAKLPSYELLKMLKVIDS